MSGATFGRKQTADGAALVARRAAFIAEERARAAQLAQGGSGFESPRPGPAATPAYVREKGLGTAYLLWFFLGGLSVHRFYLGYSSSGAVQLSLPLIGYALLASGSLTGLIFTAAAGLWILADGFMIPGMQRACNDRIRRHSVGLVFA
jgi:TM2 domain-containing membrane protein YozV